LLLLLQLSTTLLHADATYVKVGIYQNDPKLFIDAHGRPAGFFVDVLDAISRSEGWQLQYIPCTWNDCLVMLEYGDIDIMPDVAHIPERENRFLFGKEAVISSWSLLYRHPGSSIDSVLDLEGKAIAVVNESIQAHAIKSRLNEFGINASYVQVESFEKAFELLDEGLVDCVVVNRFYGAVHHKNAIATNILIKPSVLKFAFPKGEEKLRDATDRRLKELKADKTSAFYRAKAHWIEPNESPRVPQWVLWGAIGTGLLLLSMLFLILLFRRLVQKKSEELMRTSKELQHLAEHDELTGLPNRLLFMDRLYHALGRAERSKKSFAVLFFNIDNFKEINEAMSHDAGDAILRYIARTLQTVLRPGDTLARFGGDEFTVIVESLADPSRVVRMMEQLVAALKEAYILDQQPVYITFSAGIAIYPDHGSDLKTLLKHADAAMSKAKKEGKNHFLFYTENLSEKAYETLTVVAQLRDAAEHGEFELYYQPKIDAGDGSLRGSEALLRWKNPELGNVSPDHFIPLAEGHGMIIPIGMYVLKTAIAQYAQWYRDGLNPGTLSVNVSMLQLKSLSFGTQLHELMLAYGFDPARFEIELTESQLMHHPETSITILGEIHDLGIGIAVDDFGTGYSSLSYLKRLPITALKIDRSFVKELPEDSSDVEIARAIIAMAKSLGLQTVAEGVETLEQSEFLRENGCDLFQGFYYFKPMSSVAMEALLRENKAQTDLNILKDES
jgi:diguanylate cyclase (GGDEF)-like protein